MCGFLCIFGPGCDQTENFRFKNLTEALNHRGPDDFGVSSGKNYSTYFGDYQLLTVKWESNL